MKKKSEKMGCICIQVLHIRVNSHNQIIFHMVCAKKTTRVVRKKVNTHFFNVLFCLFYTERIECHFILKISTGVKNLYTYAPLFFRIFQKVLLFFELFEM